MIRIEFQEPETKARRWWVKDCELATEESRKDYAAGEPIEVAGLYKRKSIKEEVYFPKTVLADKLKYCSYWRKGNQ